MLARYTLLFTIASSLMACSSSSGSTATAKPCNDDPWQCPAGKVCWPTSTTTFACLISAAAGAGEACLDTVGMPTCADGLACLATATSPGACTPYCDTKEASHGCPGGQTCTTAEITNSGGVTFQVCTGGQGSSPDAGATMPGAGDAGSLTGMALCTAYGNHDVTQCTTEDLPTVLSQCARDESLYGPEGCGAEWEAYLNCATQATYTCSSTSFGCDTQQNAYFACESRFASRTSCSRTPVQDAKCTTAAPFGFACVSTPPTGCTALPPTGGATIACCPQFPPQ
jgi:hypothetical protein